MKPVDKKMVQSVKEDGMVDSDALIMPVSDILLGGKSASVLADTDSLYPMIGDKNWEKTFSSENIKLKPSDINPVGYGGVKIDVIGYAVMNR